MVIDFHVHGKVTSTLPFDEKEFLEKIAEAKEENMDCLVLVEHYYADNFLEAYDFLSNNYEYVQDYYDIDGFKVFVGMEITTTEGLDILVIGKRDYILSLRLNISDEIKNERYIDIGKLFNMINYNEILIILAHPYRKHAEFPKIDTSIIEKLDAIEFNARDLHHGDIEAMKNRVINLSRALNLPITGGSDSHHFMQIGSIKNKFNIECNTIRDLKEQIRTNNYEVEISQSLSIRVKSAMIIKRLWMDLKIQESQAQE